MTAGVTADALAAIDCGTNSTRLLVVDEAGRPLIRLMRITRLGEGVDATGVLSPDAIARTVAVLREFRELMDQAGVGRARLVATSAVRDAGNGDEFLAEARLTTGVEAELLAGADEGRLSLAGALSELSEPGPYLVLDIGGGSTELVVGRDAADPGLSVASMQLGCVRLTERFLTDDPPTPAQLSAAEAEVAAQLDAVIEDEPQFLSAHRLVGLAGTVSTLASLDAGLAEYDRDRIHHATLTASSVFDWYRTLAAEPATARLARPGMVTGRQDVIVGGALILASVMGRFGFDECLVSEADILDGLVGSLRA